jgi:SAM-dependent methyltransferase
MAISATHYHLLSKLSPLVPSGGSLLEIGEANWYGDITAESAGLVDTGSLFDVAKQLYAKLFKTSRVVSIDMNGTPAALKLDLNRPLPPLGHFDLVINHGTAEHVFNIAQVFASMHAACAVGGLMVHESPFTGWLDHGFYCLQPTLFYDIAAANGYEIVSVHIEEIKSRVTKEVDNREAMTELLKEGVPWNSMLFVVLRRVAPGAFVMPTQGYYSQSLSDEGKAAWQSLR